MKNQILPQTEAFNKQTQNFGFLSAGAMFGKMQKENLTAVKAVAKAKKQITAAAKLAAQTYLNKNKIIFLGAGTSGRLGILEAAECPPTFSVGYNDFKAIIAGGKKAVFKAAEGAEDNFGQGAKDFLKKAKQGDILIACAASGRTPYVLGALKAAKQNGNKTVFISCSNTADKTNAGIFIYLPTGAEVISGSTRLKAATATKCALNMITTMAMALCGKGYKNLMVDVKAVRLIAAAADTDENKAKQLALKSNYNVKAAVVMAKKNITLKQALNLLKKHKGFLDKVLDEK